MSEPLPRVSIGMPVYNGAAALGRALDSLRAQTWGAYEIIVSDNASTDDTGEIVRQYQARDPRIRYWRNPENVGASANFERALRLARGEYFMWASHDDRWAPEFIAENLARLEADPDLIASMSKGIFVDGDREVRQHWWVRHGTAPMLGTPSANARRFLLEHGQGLRFYALFRRETLLKCLPIPTYCAFDWAITLRSLAWGKYAEVPRVLFYKGVGGESSNVVRSLRGDGESRLGRWLPLWQFTGDARRLDHVRRAWGSDFALFLLNAHWSLVLLKGILQQAAGRALARRRRNRSINRDGT